MDAIGLVFAPDSARLLDVSSASAIAELAAGQTQRVGLFVNPSAAHVRQVLDSVALDVLQFHGDESATFCEQFQLPYFKALRAGSESAAVSAGRYRSAAGWLLDTESGDAFGGTGERFNWDLWPTSPQRQALGPGAWVLAGGLDAANVGAAIARLQPDMVDVSSGVEGDVKGRKDAAEMTRFVAAVRAADAQLARSGADSVQSRSALLNSRRNP